MAFQERPAESAAAIAAREAARRAAQVNSPGAVRPTRFLVPSHLERTSPDVSGLSRRPEPTTITTGSVERKGVTVHNVNLGRKKITINVAKCAGVLVGDNSRQLNRYRYKLERPRVSLASLLEGHRDRIRALARVAANPRSWWANYAFRQKLSGNPRRTNDRILFSDVPRGATARISAHVDEHGAMVVENSRGITVGDNTTQRNTFSYRMVNQEIPLEQMLHDRPDLVRTLAVAVRYPDNPAVQRTFSRQVSREYIRGHEPSLQILNLNWASPGLLVEHGAGVTVGTGTTRTDKVSLKLGRIVMTGWDSPVEKIATEIHQPAVIESVSPAISPPSTISLF